MKWLENLSSVPTGKAALYDEPPVRVDEKLQKYLGEIHYPDLMYEYQIGVILGRTILAPPEDLEQAKALVHKEIKRYLYRDVINGLHKLRRALIERDVKGAKAVCDALLKDCLD